LRDKLKDCLGTARAERVVLIENRRQPAPSDFAEQLAAVLKNLLPQK